MSKKDSGGMIPKKAAKEHFLITFIKYLAAAVCLYSVVFWGSVTVVAALRGQYEDFPPPGGVVAAMAAGEAAIIASLVLAFFRKYIIAFLLNCCGTAVFAAAARWFVKTIRRELENRVVSNDLLDMDKEYAWRYYPAVVITLLLFILAVISAARLIRASGKKRRDKENAPVKSIID